MMVTSRFGPTCGALLSLLIASTVAAQDTDRPTPPPPEPGQIESPALEGADDQSRAYSAKPVEIQQFKHQRGRE